MFDKVMQAALLADAEKLNQLTGEDHTPFFLVNNPKPFVEEGDKCPYHDCGGIIELARSGDCTCHIAPPCGACVDSYLRCPRCGADFQ